MRIIRFENIDSTQEHAKRVKIPPPFVVVSKKQLNGKGRFGRQWFSPEGGLWMTYVEKSKKLRHPGIPLGVSIAITRYLEKEKIKTKIKPPNDVYTKNGKMGGILVEFSGENIFIGVGLNVNLEYFPSYINATSMYIETGKKYDIEEVMYGVIDEIKSFLKTFKDKGFSYFLKEIKEKTSIIGENVKIETSDRWFEGTINDIDEKGNLALTSNHGKPFTVNLEEVVKIL